MCEKCKETPGWIPDENGMRACTCRKRKPEQIQLKLSDVAAVSIAATDAANRLCYLADYPRFPGQPDESARDEVAHALGEMCSTPEQIEYILKRVRQLYTSWKGCGIAGLRQILVSKYPARDGIEDGYLNLQTAAYPEGIPSERDHLTGYQAAAAIAPAPTPRSDSHRLLPAVTALTPEIMQKYAPPEPAGDLPLQPSRSRDQRMFRDAREAAKPKPKPITQADIEAEIERRKQK